MRKGKHGLLGQGTRAFDRYLQDEVDEEDRRDAFAIFDEAEESIAL